MRQVNGALLGALLISAPAAALTPQQANVIVIIADDMGVDKLGSYAADADPDYAAEASYLPDTPVLDEMAAAGVRFTDAWANPSCSPTRGALYSGQYAIRTGVGMPTGRPDATFLDPELDTLAEIMEDAGYATGLFGKWHVGENDPPEGWTEEELWYDHAGETLEHELNPITHGWRRFVGTVDGTLYWYQPYSSAYTGDGGYTDWIALDSECVDCVTPEVTVHHREDYATDATVDDTLTWIDEQTEPWLAVVALHAPHSPWNVPPEGCSYRAEGEAEPTEFIGIYEEMVECMDRRIGDLLDGLHDLGDLDDTLVIFAGDNGTEDGLSEGSFDDDNGKSSVYETGLRVPLIIADGKDLDRRRDDWRFNPDWRFSPVFVTGWSRAVSAPVHVMDLFATVAEVGGADASGGVDSVSLMPLLRLGGGDTRELVYSEAFEPDGTGVAAIRSGGWKLHTTVQEFPTGLCRVGYELYNLGVDRFEQTDLSGVEFVFLAGLQAELNSLVASEPGSWLDVPDC